MPFSPTEHFAAICAPHTLTTTVVAYLKEVGPAATDAACLRLGNRIFLSHHQLPYFTVFKAKQMLKCLMRPHTQGWEAFARPRVKKWPLRLVSARLSNSPDREPAGTTLPAAAHSALKSW